MSVEPLVGKDTFRRTLGTANLQENMFESY